MAMQVSFGPVPPGNHVPGVVRAVLDRLESQLRYILESKGIHLVSALNPPSGLLDLFVTTLGANTLEDFCYAYGPFAAKIDAGNAITMEEVEAFLTTFAAQLTWVHAAGNDAVLAAHKTRVCGRILLVLKLAANQYRPGENRAPDEPMETACKETCTKQYEFLYGEPVRPNDLPSLSVLGQMHNGIKGNFLAIPLKRLFTMNDELRGGGQAPHYQLVDPATGAYAKKEKSMRFRNSEAVLDAIKTFVLGLVFVCSIAMAPAGDWLGDAYTGIVRGVRYQFSRAGGRKWIEFWEKVARRMPNDADAIVRLEYMVRSTWTDTFANSVQLESCMLHSIRDHAGEVWAEVGVISSAKKRKADDAARNPSQHQLRKGGLGAGRDVTDLTQPGAGWTKDKNYVKAKDANGFDPRLKTYNGDSPKVCKAHNDKRDGECKYGAKCKFAHKCDVLLADGKPCLSTTHCRLGHVAELGYPS